MAEFENPLIREGSGTCPLEYKGYPVSFPAIAEWLSEEDGETVTPYQVEKWFLLLLRDLREQLAEDPYIRDWIEETGHLRYRRGGPTWMY